MQTVILIPTPAVSERAGAPGGLSLLERQLKQLRMLDLPAPLLIVPDGDPAPRLPAGLAAAGLVRVPAAVVDAGAALAAAGARLPDEFVFLSADRLVDPRVVRALAAAAAPVVASLDGIAAEPVGHATAADVRTHGAALVERARRLPLAALDRYAPELRGDAAPYVLRADAPAERAAAWNVLLDHVQKRTLDLPGQYFDAPFENWAVRRLAPTRVTPNQITLATLVLAFGIAALFAAGWLRLGVLLALVVGVLDGVDGKLARLKLQWSRLGELEHVGDFLYENAWYLALGSHLAHTGGVPAFAGWALVAADLADNLIYGLVQRRTGAMLDEVAPFDRAFRRVAGRRNVYVWIFLPGFLAGRPAASFLAALAWALCTVAVHAVRAAHAIRTLPARAD